MVIAECRTKDCGGSHEQAACSRISGLDVARLTRVNYAFTGSGESREFFSPWCTPQNKRWHLQCFARNYFRILIEVSYFYVVLLVALNNTEAIVLTL